MDRTLVLVKHSLPQIEEEVPAARWNLSVEGRARCQTLSARLAPYSLKWLVSSVEPKAAQTAEIVAARLGLGSEIARGLHEHDRSNVPFLGAAEFVRGVATFFEHPDGLVFGAETAHQACDRFASAVTNVLEVRQEGNGAIVAHGTVISLFVAMRAGLEPFALWKTLGLPSFVVLSLPGWDLLEVVEDISG